MVRITSVELQKQFRRYREIALREPVSVTHHGQDSVVMLSAEEFSRLKSFDTRKAFYAWELPEDIMRAIMTAEAPAFTAQYDDELSS